MAKNSKTKPANFRDYWRLLSAEEKRNLARRTKTSYFALAHLALSPDAVGYRRAGADLALRLQRADPFLTLEFLRQ